MSASPVPIVRIVIEATDADGTTYRITPDPGPDPANPGLRLEISLDNGQDEGMGAFTSRALRAIPATRWSSFTVSTPHGGTIETWTAAERSIGPSWCPGSGLPTAEFVYSNLTGTCRGCGYRVAVITPDGRAMEHEGRT